VQWRTKYKGAGTPLTVADTPASISGRGRAYAVCVEGARFVEDAQASRSVGVQVGRRLQTADGTGGRSADRKPMERSQNCGVVLAIERSAWCVAPFASPAPPPPGSLRWPGPESGNTTAQPDFCWPETSRRSMLSRSTFTSRCGRDSWVGAHGDGACRNRERNRAGGRL